MKAWMIKNKDGEYCDCCLWSSEKIYDGDIYEKKEDAENDAKEWNEEYPADKFEVVEITIAEGNLEEENRVLKRALELACEMFEENDKAYKLKSKRKTLKQYYAYFIKQAKKEK